MAAPRTKSRNRRPATRARRPARPVQEILLDLAYRLHATRVVAKRPIGPDLPASRA
jgi:hypothetical protein